MTNMGSERSLVDLDLLALVSCGMKATVVRNPARNPSAVTGSSIGMFYSATSCSRNAIDCSIAWAGPTRKHWGPEAEALEGLDELVKGWILKDAASGMDQGNAAMGVKQDERRSPPGLEECGDLISGVVCGRKDKRALMRLDIPPDVGLFILKPDRHRLKAVGLVLFVERLHVGQFVLAGPPPP